MSTEQNMHDPREIIRGFQQLLFSPAKCIGFFTGAGTSMAVENPSDRKPLIPGIEMLTELIGEKLSDAKEKNFKAAFKLVRDELKKENQSSQIEYVLSNIRLKARVIGPGTLCGLNQDQFKEMETKITAEIEKVVDPEIPAEVVHQKFARWIRNAKRKKAIEIFTTNYDYLFEVGLERENVSYFDGFVGSHNPFFCPSTISENDLPTDWVRLWKLHGSLGWKLDEKEKRIIRQRGPGNLMVFPSYLKYDDSRKQPYVSFIDRLDTFLREDDSFLIICGYSFGDQHLNETIVHALSRTRASAVYAFLYGEVDENHHAVSLAKSEPRLTLMANNAAVIGGAYAPWKLNREPSASDSVQISSYFDEDAVPANPLEKKTGGKEIPDQEVYWAGKGSLKLGNFVNLINFLTMMLPNETKEIS